MKRVEFKTTWTNVGPETIHDLHIYVAVPPSLPEQEIHRITWSPEPTRYLYDRYGQEIADFEVGTLRPGEMATVGFTAVGRFWQIKYNIDPDKVGSLDEIPEEIARLYLTDGPYYRISDPLIIETAQRVVGDEHNPYLMALRIHDFVAETLDYKLDGRWDDAVTVLRRGSGSCSEFTFLFIALARAVDLPARYAGGSIYIPDQAQGGTFVDRYNHRWAEVYIPGYGWVPFDPTWDSHPGGLVDRRFAGSHGYALILGRGDVDPEYLGINYIDMARGHGPAELEEERAVIWSNP
jgi:transglutaminase-like putative cysteine protease